MTGQRNENSVLFSLSNLQALAVTGQGGGGGGSSAPAARPGYASSQTEGSGLIDIRAMAASTLGVPAVGGGGHGSHEDELPAFGASSFSPVAAQVLLPMASQGMPKWVWGLFIGGGVLLITVVIMLIKIVTRPPVAVPQIAPPVQVSPTAPSGATPPAAAVAKTDDKKAAPGGVPTPAEEKKDEDKKGAHDKKVSATSSKHHGGGKPSGRESPGSASPAPSEAPPPPSRKTKGEGGKPAGGDELDKLLGRATGGVDLGSPKSSGGGESAPKRAAPPADDPNLPDQLKQGDIVRGMNAVRTRVQQCYAQFNVPGTVNTSISISPSGRVQGVQVTGKFAQTPTGDCVARAVKSASFPRFKGPAMTGIEYPWMLQK